MNGHFCKVFATICCICKYSKVYLRLIFIRFIHGAYRYLNKNKTFTVLYDFWRLSTAWLLVSLLLTSLPTASLDSLYFTLLLDRPFLLSLLHCPINYCHTFAFIHSSLFDCNSFPHLFGLTLREKIFRSWLACLLWLLPT